jgi:biuret amidohydrolase
MKFAIDMKRTVLLVIDMTNAFVETNAPLELPSTRKIIPNIKRLIRKSRVLKIPIVYTIHTFRKDGLDRGLMFDFYPQLKSGCLNEGSHGSEIYPDIAPNEDDILVRKCRYSAFFNTDLDLILRNLKKDTLAITGETTEFCCESTARDAFFRDYKVLFVSDANASNSEKAHQASLDLISAGFGEVLTTKDLLDRLGK